MSPSPIDPRINIGVIPSEKTTETLFVSHAFHYLKSVYPSLNISVFAPSQTDEDKLGYDARFAGTNFAFEVLLQFKKSKLDADVFTIKPSPIQHKLLLTTYGKDEDRSAFYVAPTFKTYDDLGKKQAAKSEEFLNHYLAVNVKSLALQTTRIRYKAEFTGEPANVCHLEKHKQDQDSVSLSSPKDWLKGSELFKFFLEGISIIRKPRDHHFHTINPNSIGYLVYFNDASNRGVRFYHLTSLIDRTIGDVIDDLTYQRDERVKQSDNIEGIPSLSTSGTYIFRVYDPFLDK